MTFYINYLNYVMLTLIVTTLVLVAVGYAVRMSHLKLTFRKPLHLDASSVVVLTGGCDGIGRLTALELAKLYKCKLVILDIQANKFKDLETQLRNHGSEVQCIQTDLSNKESMDKALNQIKGRYPSIDVLVNNAGIAFQEPIEKASTYERNLKTLSVNFLGPVYLFTSLIDQLKGHVVNVASVASILRGNNLASYTASKAAIYSFFNSARMELSDRKPNITVSLVCPWAVNTGMFEGFQTKFNKVIPMLEPDAVSKVIVNTIVNRREVVFIPENVGILIKLINLLPEYYVDKAFKWGDTSVYTNNRQKGK